MGACSADIPGRYLVPVDKSAPPNIRCQDVSDQNQLTSINLFADEVLNSALIGLRHGLLLDRAAAVIEALGLVHGALQCVTLPAEHVIGVGTGRSTLEAPQEGIPVLRGIPKTVERCCVPCDFECYPLILDLAYTRFGGVMWAFQELSSWGNDLGAQELRSLHKLWAPFEELSMLWDDLLWDSDRVGVGALWSIVEVLRVDGVVHVRLVIGAVEVLAIPAARFLF